MSLYRNPEHETQTGRLGLFVAQRTQKNARWEEIAGEGGFVWKPKTRCRESGTKSPAFCSSVNQSRGGDSLEQFGERIFLRGFLRSVHCFMVTVAPVRHRVAGFTFEVFEVQFHVDQYAGLFRLVSGLRRQ